MNTVDSLVDARTLGYKLQIPMDRYMCEAIIPLSA
jgi:hypothetical protein